MTDDEVSRLRRKYIDNDEIMNLIYQHYDLERKYKGLQIWDAITWFALIAMYVASFFKSFK